MTRQRFASGEAPLGHHPPTLRLPPPHMMREDGPTTKVTAGLCVPRGEDGVLVLRRLAHGGMWRRQDLSQPMGVQRVATWSMRSYDGRSPRRSP